MKYKWILPLFLLSVVACGGKKSKKAADNAGVETAQRADEAIILGNQGLDLLTNYSENTDSLKKSVLLFEKAIKIDKKNELTYYNLAKAWFKLGKDAEALNALDQVIAVNPNRPDPYVHKGALFDILGREKEAIASYDKGLSLLKEALMNGHGEALLNELGICFVYYMSKESDKYELEIKKLTYKYKDDPVSLDYVKGLDEQLQTTTPKATASAIYE